MGIRELARVRVRIEAGDDRHWYEWARAYPLEAVPAAMYDEDRWFRGRGFFQCDNTVPPGLISVYGRELQQMPFGVLVLRTNGFMLLPESEAGGQYAI